MAGSSKKNTQVVDRAGQVREVLRLMEEEAVSENKACEMVGIHRNTFRSAGLKVLAADEYARANAAVGVDRIGKADEIMEKLERGEIDANAARVMLDQIRWYLSKLLPRQYGDKLDVTSNGETVKPISPIQVNILSTDQNRVVSPINEHNVNS